MNSLGLNQNFHEISSENLLQIDGGINWDSIGEAFATGAGAAIGAKIGGAIGSTGGPVGAIVGGIIGGAAGALIYTLWD